MRRLGRELLAAQPDIARSTASSRTELGNLFPELRSVDAGAMEKQSDLAEQHAQLQAALLDWFLESAAAHPIVILVDDEDSADESSASLLAKLTRQSSNEKLALIVTRRAGIEERSFRRSARGTKERTVRVHSLTAEATRELSEAVLGPVENIRQLGQRLFEQTEGNPLQIVDAIRQLIGDQVVVYENGKWNVPTDLGRSALRSGMHQLYARRIEALSDGARNLAKAMSVESRTLSVAACAALSGATVDQVDPLLEELLFNGVLLKCKRRLSFQSRCRADVPVRDAA